MPDSKVIYIEIEGMSCMKCVGRIQKVLESTPGVSSAQVDLGAGMATVKASAEVDEGQLVDRIYEAGYDARVRETE